LYALQGMIRSCFRFCYTYVWKNSTYRRLLLARLAKKGPFTASKAGAPLKAAFFSRQFRPMNPGRDSDGSLLTGQRSWGGGAVMNDGTIETSRPSIPDVGSFVTVRGKAWIVEGPNREDQSRR